MSKKTISNMKCYNCRYFLSDSGGHSEYPAIWCAKDHWFGDDDKGGDAKQEIDPWADCNDFEDNQNSSPCQK